MKRPPVIAALALVLALVASLAWPVEARLERAGAGHSLRVLAADGTLLREFKPEGRGYAVTLGDVAPGAVRALVATEDQRFWRHPGVDPVAVARAAWSNARGGRVESGASTITMQVARAVRQAEARASGRAAPARTWRAKLAEAHLAVRMEARMSKTEILEAWLSRVAFAPGVTGIEAAARHVFGKSAKDLTLPEAALLVGLPQRPTAYDPHRHPERALARQREVLAAMEREAMLSPDDRARHAATPLAFATPPPPEHAHHLAERARHAALELGAASVTTTIDAGLQRFAETAARAHRDRLGAQHVGQVAALVLGNATGEVLAYVGSADFYDGARAGQNDGVRMLRQPGSALKPFLYGAAFDRSLAAPATILADVETTILEAGGAFTAENYDRAYHGPVPLREALASSYNVPAVRMAQRLGPAVLLETLRGMGFASLTAGAEHYGVGLALGNGEVRLLDLARAYASLSRGGTLPPLRTLRAAATSRGDTLALPAELPASRGALSAQASYLLTHVLSDPEARAPGFGRGGPLELPFPAAVKTGTSKDYRDNWAVGTTPRHTVAVWAGNFGGAPMRWVSGVSGAAPLMRALLLHLDEHQGRHYGAAGDFARPAGIETATVCPTSGARPGAFCPLRRAEVFAEGTAPSDTCHVHRRLWLDRSTGALADAATPPADREARTFAVHPPEFHAWMRKNGVPMPPVANARDAATHGGATTVPPTTSHPPHPTPHKTPYSPLPTPQLHVRVPANGARFVLDPVLRADYQRLHLRGEAEEGLRGARWLVDGQPHPGEIGGAPLVLTPGRHRIELVAQRADGTEVRSAPALIDVRGAAP